MMSSVMTGTGRAHPDTVMHLGSTMKVFNAILVMWEMPDALRPGISAQSHRIALRGAKS